ncbi:MAG: hypothetical protein RML46_09780 [Anaerolineae bacterium]|nr:hypothetical protein [Anaerolineae bacterium]MDW8069192.1 hypothetical protein [Anaerolineae bacterium]
MMGNPGNFSCPLSVPPTSMRGWDGPEKGEINLAPAWLNLPPSPAETPAERAPQRIEWLLQAKPWVGPLLNRYQAAIYGNGPMDHPAARLAGRAIRLLS